MGFNVALGQEYLEGSASAGASASASAAAIASTPESSIARETIPVPGPVPPSLDPPRVFEPGTILTLRMRGHTRSPNQSEYFAPAVVLEQFMPGGEISVLIWDSSAGTHYNASYPVRDLGVRGEGGSRDTYELRSNVGDVLFSPAAFASMTDGVDTLTLAYSRMRGAAGDLEHRIAALEMQMKELAPLMDVSKSEAAAGAATRNEPSKPKA
jgi:hypothetical protein